MSDESIEEAHEVLEKAVEDWRFLNDEERHGAVITALRHIEQSLGEETDWRVAPDGSSWDRAAAANTDDWGVQHPSEVLDAISEEVGEISQAYLEATHEGAEKTAVEEEIDDLGPLLMQLVESLRTHPLAFEPLPTAEELECDE